MSIDDLNWLVGELRASHVNAYTLRAALDTYKGLPRTYVQAAKPYLYAHRHDILALDDREWQSTVDCIDTLPIEALTIDGYSRSIARKDARGIYDMIRGAYRAKQDVRLTLSIVHGVDVWLELTWCPKHAYCEVIGGTYTAQWFTDEAREHTAAIDAAAAEANALVREGASVWSVWRAALRAACEHVDADQWIHETYEHDSYTQACTDAEWGVICEVAGALHPEYTYSDFRDAEQDSEPYHLIGTLGDILHTEGIHAETEESCGDIYAYLPNSARLRRILDDFAQEWYGPGADPEEIQIAVERALDWAH